MLLFLQEMIKFSWSLLTAYFAISAVWSADVDSYIASQTPIAQAGLLANIGPDGAKASGASSGVVIASPSTSNPNYLFTWIRDSSLVFTVLIDQYAAGKDDSLQQHISNFITAQSTIQQIPNPSGNISTGGLGEPKFNINLTAFTDPWGRPQRDGPALRSTALINFANYLISTGNTSFVSNTLWPIIKLDLDYVAKYWNQSTFDLWEEINSSSFFTTAAQHKSLRLGISLANSVGDTSSLGVWQTQADNLLCFLNTYYTGSYILANTGGGRSGLDSNTILASIHTFDPDAGCDSATFQPCSDKALSNLFQYVNSFRGLYGLNSAFASNQAIAVGRYKEDVYFNGNPWYLCTLAVAEQLYDALYVYKARGSINITDTTLPFFQSLVSSASTGSFQGDNSVYSSLISALQSFADGFVAIVAQYTPSGGGLSEQFDKNTGAPLSAADLTWSYASALTAFNARNNLVNSSSGIPPKSWGASGLQVPSQCGSNPLPTVDVTFVVQAETQLGENIFVTGNIPQLSNWDPSTAIPLQTDSTAYPNWNVTISLPSSTAIQYKYIRVVSSSNQVTWESDPNRSINTPASGAFTENDVWR